MDAVDKLSCKEEMHNISDLEQSPPEELKDLEEKSKKKKRRRREIDMIKLSDDDDSDDEGSTKKSRFSPGSNSPASHREPRTCVLKASQKRRPLSRLLEQLLKNLEKRDPNNFFAWPVNDNFAPNYSKIIKKPMDFCTMKQKIDDNEYKSLNCFISDFKLICNNAMKYNKPGTVYHKAARRLLHAGLKQLTPQKLRPLGHILTYMYEIPIRELGFDIGNMDLKVMKRSSSPLKSGSSEPEEPKSDDLPETDDLKVKMARARDQHRRRLAKKAFPRMDADGKTTLRLVTGATETGGEKPMTLGQYIGKLQHGTGTLHSLREDRRNYVKGVKPLNYGPFSSFAPTYDSTFATLTKDESHLLYHTLPYELGQGNEELLRFAPDSPWVHIYDMEALFPDKKSIPEPAPPPPPPPQDDANELTKVKRDIESLRSLSALGIDTEFLCEIERDVTRAERDYGLCAALAHTHGLLAQAQRDQLDRLSAAPPAHLALCPAAGAREREAARLAVSCLRAMCARVPPGELAAAREIREAMGVSLTHLDTPMSAENAEDLTELENVEMKEMSSEMEPGITA